MRLERDGIVLPALDELEDDSYPTAMAAVRHAVDGAGWRVDETAVLSTFTFQKEVIYRDLRVNEDTIAAHAMVRLLAEGPTSSQLETMAFAPEPEEGLDDRHPPEDLACILDADATQRRCLIAARQGHSFVMDGPPGTGKSQTIANVIAQLLRDGKTVLFVSEKAAALEVVQDRLTDVKPASIRSFSRSTAIGQHARPSPRNSATLSRRAPAQPRASTPSTVPGSNASAGSSPTTPSRSMRSGSPSNGTSTT